MSVKSALENVIEVLDESSQKVLLLKASEMLQDVPVGGFKINDAPQEQINFDNTLETSSPSILRKKAKPKKHKRSLKNDPPLVVFGSEFRSYRSIAEAYDIKYERFLRHAKKSGADLDAIVRKLVPAQQRVLGKGGNISVIRRPAAENMKNNLPTH
jgi:pyruvate dehydrogenase complex dehydrogenase (E1) component